MIGPTLERLCACQSTERTWRERTRGAGVKGSFVLQWFFRFENAQEQAPVQVPNHDKFFDAQTTSWPSLTLRLTYVHLDSCNLTIAYTLLPGITGVLSLQADASQMACCRIDCKVALNWSVALSYAYVLCARLFITWTTLIRTVQTITFDPGPGRRRGLEGKGGVEVTEMIKGISFLFLKFSSRDFFGDRKIWHIQIYIDIFGSLI